MKYSLSRKPPATFIKKYPELHPVLVTLLWQRGLRERTEIQEFLECPYTALPDPYIFKEMELVVKRLIQAAKNRERVMVYGDYDVDGVTATVLMVETLEKLYAGDPDLISVYLPHRELEGYGLNAKAVEHIINNKIQLLITCDCGSTNIPELQALRQAKIDTIVLDHHVAANGRPPVLGFVNPKYKAGKYPFRDLAAAGVIFKVVQALRQYLNKQGTPILSEGFEKWSLDLVALATVADVMPLVRENRILVKWGMLVLSKTKRIGLQELIKTAGLSREISITNINFAIAPRLNAAGRVDHANVAYDLLRQTKRQAALMDAEKLEQANRRRQAITEKIFQAADVQVATQYKRSNLVLVARNFTKKDWPVGIIGLVAGKLVNKYQRPAFVIARSEHGLAGSGRSVDNFDIIQAVGQTADLFDKFGGHPQACGFTFKDGGAQKLTTEFKKRIEQYAKSKISAVEMAPEHHISVKLDFAQINFLLTDQIERLQPFGESNECPIFLSTAVKIVSVKIIGNREQHRKLMLRQGPYQFEGLIYNFSPQNPGLNQQADIDIIYTISLNEWRGQRRIEFVILDYKNH